MNTQDAERLKTLFLRVARECSFPDHKDIATDAYSTMIEDISPVFSQGNKEAVFVYKPRKGERIATSVKVSNFRFKIIDFLLQVPDNIVKIVGTNGTHLMYFYLMTLLVKLFRLGSMPLDQGEIDILMLVHRFYKQRRIITTDQVHQMLSDKWSNVQISEALGNLSEKLHCIEIGANDEIEAVEAIVFLN